MGNRYDFRRTDIDILAKRVGGRCSNPGCRRLTSGPNSDPARAISIGVAAHISAASTGGPRYDPALSPEERGSLSNAIWLCQNCSTLVDRDVGRYTADALRDWRMQAEASAQIELEGVPQSAAAAPLVDLVLKRRNERTSGERHDYRLEVTLHNAGAPVFGSYHVDLELPTAVLRDTSGRVEDRSNRDTSLFRMRWSGPADDVFPGDTKRVFAIPYFMDETLYHRRGLFDLPVRATLYEGGHRRVHVEERFEAFQSF